MDEKLDLDALKKIASRADAGFISACDAAGDLSEFPNLAFVAKFTPMVALAMIARIRELEAELERASQPGSGEADPPSGWKLVPVEPTDEMLDATRGKNCSPGTWNNWQKKRHATIYRQMVTAARDSLDGRS